MTGVQTCALPIWLVEDALQAGVVDVQSLARYTDEGLMHRLESALPSQLLVALKGRKLYKRAAEWPAAELDDDKVEWIASDRKRVAATENTLAKEFGLAPGELLLDYPAKTQMLGLDIPVLRQQPTFLREWNPRRITTRLRSRCTRWESLTKRFQFFIRRLPCATRCALGSQTRRSLPLNGSPSIVWKHKSSTI